VFSAFQPIGTHRGDSSLGKDPREPFGLVVSSEASLDEVERDGDDGRDLVMSGDGEEGFRHEPSQGPRQIVFSGIFEQTEAFFQGSLVESGAPAEGERAFLPPAMVAMFSPIGQRHAAALTDEAGPDGKTVVTGGTETVRSFRPLDVLAADGTGLWKEEVEGGAEERGEPLSVRTG